MKTVSLSFILSALALSLVAAKGSAQIGPSGSALPSVVVNFAIPQSADPSRLTYTAFGTMYTNTDGSVAGDNQGAVINGALLEPNGGGGLELHGQVPSGVPGRNTSVTEVDFYTNYTGTLMLTSTGNNGSTPWDFGFLTPLPGYAQGFRYFKTLASQADINDDSFNLYAILTAVPTDPNDTSFAASGVGAVGTQYSQDVPEPGTLALLGGLCAGGGLLWRRRAARTK